MLVYNDHITVYTRQLDVAFSDPAEFGRFMAELKLLRSDLQKQNIINDRLNIQPKDSAVDILASVVAPPKKER